MQLKDYMVERQRQFDEDKNAGMKELKDVYDEKITAYRESLDQIGSELEASKLEVSDLKAQLSARIVEDSDAVLQRDVLKKRLEDLLHEMESLRRHHSTQIGEKTKLLHRIRKMLKQKDEDFDALMDVKIALAMEIKAYRLLLENEEARLGYVPPSVKAARDAHASLVIAAMDLDGNYITIRNGSIDATALEGWTLKALSSKAEFKFPSSSVPSGASFKVWTGPTAAAQAARSPGDLVWPGAVWNPAGDSALLIDPQDRVISKVDVNPE